MRRPALALRTLLCGLLAGIALFGAPAGAAPITLTYSGTITFLDDPAGDLDPAIIPGAEFTAELKFDPDTATVADMRTTSTRYDTTPAPVLTIMIGSTTLTQTLDALSIGNDASGDAGPRDFWGSLIETSGPGPYISFSYIDDTGTRLSDTSFFVPSESDFTGWTEVGVLFATIGGGEIVSRADGTIYLVPEPSTGLLLLLGLVPLCRGRRARP